MSVSSVSNQNNYAANTAATAAAAENANAAAAAAEELVQEDPVDTVEISKKPEKKYYTYDKEALKGIFNKYEQQTNSLKLLVEKLLKSQGKLGELKGKGMDPGENALALKKLIEDGYQFDAATIQQAQNDISEDGYWGVEAVSDRLVDFAKAISGDDPAAYEKLKKAIEAGFGEARKAWGSKMPDITQQTYDATMKKLEEWKNSMS